MGSDEVNRVAKEFIDVCCLLEIYVEIDENILIHSLARVQDCRALVVNEIG